MHLFQHLEVGGQRLDKDGFFIADGIGHDVQISRGEHQVIGKGSVAVDNPKRGAMGTMSRHATLAIRAVKTMAGGGDFANDALANQGRESSRSWAFMHSFNDADKFMTYYALEGHV